MGAYQSRPRGRWCFAVLVPSCPELAPYLATNLRLPLFEKRPQAFLALGRHAARGDRVGGDGIASSAGARQTSRDQRLRGGDRSGAAVETRRRTRSTVASSSAAGTTACTSPISSRARRRSARRSGTARARPTGRSSPATNGEMTAGTDPELDLGEPEDRVLRGDDDVADGGEAGAAAERGAVHAADRAARGSRRSRRTSRDVASRRGGSRSRCRRPSSPSTRRRRRRRTPCRRPASDDDAHAVGSLGDRVAPPSRRARAITRSLNALRTSGRLSVRCSTAPSRRESDTGKSYDHA